MLYPLNSLFFFLPFDMAFNAIIILHFFLGGLFTYLFVKDLKVNSTGALISGLIFMLSGYLLSVHSLLTILLSSIWTPLIMMFFRRAINGEGFKNEIFAALLITLSFLGGGIEIVYGNFLVLLIMVIFSPFSSTKFVGDKPRRYKFLHIYPIYWRRIRSLSIVSVLCLSLSAIQLFPFLELFHHSIRGNGISYQEATIWSFAPKDTLLFFLPDAYGYWLDTKKYWLAQCWFKTLYTGGLPFILSLIFFLAPHPQKHLGEPLCGVPNQAATEGRPYKMCYFGSGRKLYFALMFFSVFLSLGHYNPLYPFVFKYVPFFNGIRYPAKFLYIFILVLSTTAGLGFQRLVEFSKEKGRKGLMNILIIFSLISGFLLLILVFGHKEIEPFLKLRGIDYPQFNFLRVNLFHAKRFFFYLALFFLLIRVGHEKRWKSWAKLLLVLFMVIDLFGNMGYFGKEKTENFSKKSKSLEKISSDKGNFRLFSTEKTTSMDTNVLVLIDDPTYLNLLKERNLPSINLFYPLHDIWGNDVIRVKRTDDLYRVLISSPSISTTHLLDLYGVKYITSVTPLEGKKKFELIYANLEGLQGKRKDLLKENTIKLYKNRNPLSRAWLVGDYKVMDSGTILSKMIGKDFYPDREALLEEEPKWITKGGSGGLKESLPGTQNQGGHRGPPLRRTNDAGKPLSRFPQKVQILSESNNRLDLQVNAEENSLLVLSDTYYPGWKAFVDGKETKIYRADYAFRALPLNTGTQRVEFVYDPTSFKLGAGVTILGILGCIGMGLASRYRRRGVPPRAPEIGRPQTAAPTKN
jgi:hypothetical protein